MIARFILFTFITLTIDALELPAIYSDETEIGLCYQEHFQKPQKGYLSICKEIIYSMGLGSGIGIFNSYLYSKWHNQISCAWYLKWIIAASLRAAFVQATTSMIYNESEEDTSYNYIEVIAWISDWIWYITNNRSEHISVIEYASILPHKLYSLLD